MRLQKLSIITSHHANVHQSFTTHHIILLFLIFLHNEKLGRCSDGTVFNKKQNVEGFRGNRCSGARLQKQLRSLKLAARAPENRPKHEKEMNHLPTIHFQGRTCC